MMNVFFKEKPISASEARGFMQVLSEESQDYRASLQEKAAGLVEILLKSQPKGGKSLWDLIRTYFPNEEQARIAASLFSWGVIVGGALTSPERPLVRLKRPDEYRLPPELGLFDA